MVDFSKHLKGTQNEREPVLMSGTLISWTLPVGGDPAEAKQRECEWEIVTRTSPRDGAQWEVFLITKGGVTGFESFSLSDEDGLMLYTMGRFGNPKGYWSACAGTLRSWHQQRVPHQQMMPILSEYLQMKELIVRVCMHCWNGLGEVPSQGGGGGWSHTICDDCSEE